MGVKWTEEQQQVIDHRSGDLLVSAAAGSGKTAVLVAHIMSRLMDKEKPLDIGRLLLVTFTDAAAAEMRDRLIRSLDAAADEDPENVRIADQIARVPKAHIQTIDSFCMWLVRNNFHKLDIDPDFRIAEEGEGRLMRADVMDELLEEKYEEGTESFLDFIDRFSRGKDDAAVSELILNMYGFSQSAPDPDKWLAECSSSVCTTADSLDDYHWADMLSSLLRTRIKEQASFLSSAAAMVVDYDCLESLRQVLEDESRSLVSLSNEESLDAIIIGIRAFKKGRMTHRKIHDEEPEGKDFLKRMQAAFGGEWDALKKSFAFAAPEEMCEVLREAGGPILELVELTKEFAHRYEMEKKDNNLADFSDVEHWALKLLKDNEELAEELSLQFDEIAIDEYQDSNLIQEEILTAVSGARRGARNMLMVGDVKQSIYKFRMAKPELFMGKYDRYPKQGMVKDVPTKEVIGEDGSERLIELSKNFRTRASVLDVVNHVFFRIMRRELGGVEYTEDCALNAGADFPDYPENGLLVHSQRDFKSDNHDQQDNGQQDNVQQVNDQQVNDQQDKGQLDNVQQPHDRLDDDLQANDHQKTVSEGTYPVELMLTVCGQGQDRNEIEARAVAEKIRKMTDPVDGLKLWDADKGEFRSAHYSDIAILMRRVHGSAAIFEETLRSCSIPAVSRQSTGYFDAVEVQVLLNALAVIDNPAQDIPLASVMLSPMSSFDEDDLAIATAWYKAYRRNAAGKTGTAAFAGKTTSVDTDAAGVETVADAITAATATTATAATDTAAAAAVTVADAITATDTVVADVATDSAIINNAVTDSAATDSVMTDNSAVSKDSRAINMDGAGSFYYAIKRYATDGDDEELKARFVVFLEKLDALREYAVHNTIYDLIGEILRRTGYDLYLSALPAGNIRRLNIEMLKQRAAAFEKTSYHGIFQFNRYIDKLRKYDVDFGEAQTESEQDDVVRIMSIHKSKGLEYPVVFVCGCDGAFDNRDSSRTVILHDDLGAASDFIDIENSQKRKSLWKSLVADRIRRDNRGEELRVLYVAMTRAKEKLILSGVLKERASKEEDDLVADVKAKLMEAEELMETGAGKPSDIVRFSDTGKLPTWYIAGASSFLDWLLMAFGDAQDLVPITINRKLNMVEEQLTRVGESGLIRHALEAIPPAEGNTLMRWEQQLDCGYKYEAATEMKGIWTVSELKEEAGGLVRLERPEKTSAPSEGGAARGIVYHHILQNMPPTQDSSAVLSWMKQNMPISQATMVDPEDIAGFYRSQSGSLCMKPRIKRHVEQPFVFGLPESIFFEGRKNGFVNWKRKPTEEESLSYKDEELILIQGIIDLYLEEDDGITLVDYKTDAASPEQIMASYAVQLRCYAMALSRITGKQIKAIRIYSFHNRCEIEVD